MNDKNWGVKFHHDKYMYGKMLASVVTSAILFFSQLILSPQNPLIKSFGRFLQSMYNMFKVKNKTVDVDVEIYGV